MKDKEQSISSEISGIKDAVKSQNHKIQHLEFVDIKQIPSDTSLQLSNTNNAYK